MMVGDELYNLDLYVLRKAANTMHEKRCIRSLNSHDCMIVRNLARGIHMYIHLNVPQLVHDSSGIDTKCLPLRWAIEMSLRWL